MNTLDIAWIIAFPYAVCISKYLELHASMVLITFDLLTWWQIPSDKGRSIWGGVSTLPCLRERFNVVRVRSRTLKTQCFFKRCRNFGIIYIVMFSVMCVWCTKMSLVLGGVAWPYPCSFCMCFQVAEFDDGSSYPNSFNSGGSSSWQGIFFW